MVLELWFEDVFGILKLSDELRIAVHETCVLYSLYGDCSSSADLRQTLAGDMPDIGVRHDSQ